MAITAKLDDLLYDRRMTLTELAERVGITIVNLSILKTFVLAFAPVAVMAFWLTRVRLGKRLRASLQALPERKMA